jgi:mono/diheme cytochrome c family protein
MSALAISADAAFVNAFQTVLKAASAWLIVGPAMAFAAEPITDVMLSSGGGFSEQDGESLYRASCQACHMSQGEGASGAGRYPPLANNARLASATYPVINVLHGRDGMPGFAGYMSDQQIAMVVNYARTHFGNNYPDAVTPDDVKKLR